MNKIKELRNAKQMKQSDLAKLLNCQPTTISNYETGYRDLDSGTILRLCEIFECTADYLLGRSPLIQMKLTPEEESFIIALRRSDSRAKDMVHLALEPFWQEELDPKVI